jgi:hypothetical protein
LQFRPVDMGEAVSISSEAVAASASRWLRAHLFDVTVVLLATVLMLRFWYILFGVQDGRVIAILTTAALCEALRCLIASYRRNIRPQFVTADRRSDLLAAIALATAPWPLMPPVRAASALWSLSAVSPMADSVRPLCAVVVLLLSMRRLQSSAK